MHAGYLRTKCGSCHAQEPEVRDALGCNPLVSANAPAWQFPDGEKVVSFMNCPSMFIPQSVMNWWTTYKGYQRARFAIPRADEQPRKFLEACDIYENWKPYFEALQMKDEEARMKTSGLKKLGTF